MEFYQKQNLFFLAIETRNRNRETVHALTVKVEGAGAVLVDLLDDVQEVVLGELVVQLPEDLLERVGGDVSVVLLVVDPEGLLQLLLQRLLVLLDQEAGGQLTELAKLEEARTWGNFGLMLCDTFGGTLARNK